jgi:hypothetical protein
MYQRTRSCRPAAPSQHDHSLIAMIDRFVAHAATAGAGDSAAAADPEEVPARAC